MTSTPLTYRKIFFFWLPLASTWLMMAVEGPYLAAIIARLPEPTINLAAFGIALAFAIIIEAPVIMLMSASTALVEDRDSFFALRRFAYGLCISLTIVQVLVLTPPVFTFLTAVVMNLPSDVSLLTHQGLTLLLPWPAAVGYRRFQQGLLIRKHLTHRVAYGTGFRLLTMSLSAIAVYWFLPLDGVHVGTIGLSTGVVVEAVASRFMTRSVVTEILHKDSDVLQESNPALHLINLIKFYVPLGLTSVLALAIQPLLTFFMGQSRNALESLAVFPIVHGIVFIFRAIGLSYLEVVIALSGNNNAVGLSLATVCTLSIIAFTPLAEILLQNVFGLTAQLTTFALPPLQILAVFPALSVLLSLQRGALVQSHYTPPITLATFLEASSVGIALLVTIYHFDLIGISAAAIAFLLGRIVGNLSLMPTWSRILDKNS